MSQASCSNKSCSRKAGDFSLLCPKGCSFAVCLDCYRNVTSLPKQCVKCNTRSDPYKQGPSATADKLRAIHPDLMVAAMMIQSGEATLDDGPDAPPPVKSKNVKPLLEDAASRHADFKTFWNSKGGFHRFDNAKWETFMDCDYENGHYPKNIITDPRKKYFWTAQPITIPPTQGTQSEKVDPCEGMKKVSSISHQNGYSDRYWGPQGGVDVNSYAHSLISYGSKGFFAYDQGLQAVAQGEFSNVFGIEANPASRIYAIGHKGQLPSGREGTAITLTSFDDPATPLAVVDSFTPIPGMDDYAYERTKSFAFLDRTNPGHLAVAEYFKIPEGTTKAKLLEDANYVSIYDVFTGDRVQMFGTSYFDDDTIIGYYHHEPQIIRQDPFRNNLFYSANNSGVAYFDPRVNSKRAVRFIRSQLYEGGSSGASIQFLLPDYGSVNTMVFANSHDIITYDITKGAVRTSSSYEEMGLPGTIGRIAYYGKQLAMTVSTMSSPIKVAYVPYDGAGIPKNYYSTEFGGSMTYFASDLIWNSTGLYFGDSTNLFHGANYPTATPLVDSASTAAPTAVPKGIGAGIGKGIGKGIGAAGAASAASKSAFSTPLNVTPPQPKIAPVLNAFNLPEQPYGFRDMAWVANGNDPGTSLVWISAGRVGFRAVNDKGEATSVKYPSMYSEWKHMTVDAKSGFLALLFADSLELRPLSDLNSVARQIEVIDCYRVAILKDLGRIVCFGRTCYIYDLASGRRVSTFELNHLGKKMERHNILYVTPDPVRPGVVYVGGDTLLFIYDFNVDTAKPARVITLPQEGSSLAVMQSGACDKIAVGTRNGVLILNPATGAVLSTVLGGGDYRVVSACGDVLAAVHISGGTSKRVVYVSFASGETISTSDCASFFTGNPQAFGITPNGTMLVYDAANFSSYV